MLAMPVKRWQIIFGTFVGIVLLVALSIIYFTGGLLIIIGLKTGYWAPSLLLSGFLAVAAFATVYSVMMLASVIVRNTAFSIALAYLTIAFGIVASYRIEIAKVIDPGVSRFLFEKISLIFPKIAGLANQGAEMVIYGIVDLPSFAKILAVHIIFPFAMLFIAISLFVKNDY